MTFETPWFFCGNGCLNTSSSWSPETISICFNGFQYNFFSVKSIGWALSGLALWLPKPPLLTPPSLLSGSLETDVVPRRKTTEILECQFLIDIGIDDISRHGWINDNKWMIQWILEVSWNWNSPESSSYCSMDCPFNNPSSYWVPHGWKRLFQAFQVAQKKTPNARHRVGKGIIFYPSDTWINGLT